MKPRLLNLAAGVSLLLAVAILVLWIRSHAHREEIAHFWHTSTEQCGWHVQSRYSTLAFMIFRVPDTGPNFARSLYYDYTPEDSKHPIRQQWLPFPAVRFEHRFPPVDDYDIGQLTIAYWFLLLPTLVLPALVIARHRRRRHRETNNLCPTCGYDLRATPNRCPECGTSALAASEVT